MTWPTAAGDRVTILHGRETDGVWSTFHGIRCGAGLGLTSGQVILTTRSGSGQCDPEARTYANHPHIVPQEWLTQDGINIGMFLVIVYKCNVWRPLWCNNEINMAGLFVNADFRRFQRWLIAYSLSANMIHRSNDVSMLGQRQRRWYKIKTSLDQRLVFARSWLSYNHVLASIKYNHHHSATENHVCSNHATQCIQSIVHV